MKKIKLTRGKYAIIDDEDFDFLNQFKWYCSFYGYAVRDVGGRKNKKCIFMHRIINKTKDNEITDHINRNRLDNRRCNLRTVTSRENIINRGLNKNNSSGYKGIVFRKDIKKWNARIKINYRDISLGCFINIKDAVFARKQAEIKYNFIVSN